MIYKFRGITVLLVVCLMLTAFIGIDAYAYTDTAGSWAEKEIAFVSDYGIMQGYENGSFYPDNAITRAEAVTVALRMIQLDNVSYDGNYAPTFSDVGSGHWAFANIETAASMNIVSGDPQGTFRPDDLVSYQEMTKIIVCLLGYEIQAQATGGWPTGYMRVAESKDLFNYSGVNVTEPASRAAVSVMVYNAMQTNIMEPVSYGGDDMSYAESDNTLIDIYFDSQISEGILTGTYVTGLYGDAADLGKVSIDNVMYNCSGDYTQLIGNQVRYSYTEKDGIRTIVYITKNPAMQKEVTVSADDAELVEGIYTANGKFIYFEGEDDLRANTLKLSHSVSLIYNNQYIPYSELGSVSLNIAEGSYQLIDYDRNNVYDCMKVLSYKDYYVNNTSSNDENKYITDGRGNSLIYTADEDELYERIVFGSSVIGFEDIAQGDIISAAVSPDNKKVEIIVSRTVVDGSVTQIGDDNGETVIGVGDNLYKLSAAPADNIEAELSVSGKFYLNAFGDVTYIVEDSATGEYYGYFSKINKQSGLDDTVQVLMLTTENTFATLDVADKVKFYDGTGVDITITESEFYSRFYKTPTYNDPTNVNTPQVVKYKLNSQGELSLIRIAKTTPDVNEFSVGYVNPDNGEVEGRRYYSNKVFDEACKVTDETVLFRIPWTWEGEDYTRYRSGRATKFLTEGNYYQVKIFDVDEEKGIGAIMLTVYGQKKDITYDVSVSSPVMVVDSVEMRIDEATDEARTYVCGIVNGEYTSVPMARGYENLLAPNMRIRGSVIQYGTNDSTLQAAYYADETPGIAAITALNIRGLSPQTVKYNNGNVQMPSAGKKTTYGTVDDIVGFTVTVNVPDYVHSTQASYFMDENVQVVIVESGSKKLDVGTFYDIRPGDEIFIRQRYNKIKEVVLYR